jgi:hypothetical protein
MCDYSLHGVMSRPAKIGDKLATTEFTNTTTGGFAGVDDPMMAVCLQPGTELVFENAPLSIRQWRVILRCRASAP